MRRRRLLEPPSVSQWRVDAEMNGHSVAQTLQYISDCMDWQDAQAARRSHPDVISVDMSPSLLPGWLRRRARRAARG